MGRFCTGFQILTSLFSVPTGAGYEALPEVLRRFLFWENDYLFLGSGDHAYSLEHAEQTVCTELFPSLGENGWRTPPFKMRIRGG